MPFLCLHFRYKSLVLQPAARNSDHHAPRTVRAEPGAIEDVRVELQPGFCVWTGETGAGKSLLLGALGLLLGERGSADLLRAGADELRVSGRFELETPGCAARSSACSTRRSKRTKSSCRGG